MITVNTEGLYMLDMRGKKKKTTWEKWDAGNWLPRSPVGATRHYNQMGFSLSQLCRDKQRKVYPTEVSLKKALLSMLPKHLRNMEMKLDVYNIVYGETDGYLASFYHEEEKVGRISIRKHPNGWVLKFGSDTIRSFTKELMEGIDRITEMRNDRTLHITDAEAAILLANSNPIMQAFVNSEQTPVVQRLIPEDAVPSTDGLVVHLRTQREERTERMIQRVELSKPWVEKNAKK